MHEISLAYEVIELAKSEAEKNSADTVLEISIEVGDLSGVECYSFRSALELVVKDSILENATIDVIRIKGKGRCSSCNKEFEMNQRFDPCPDCNCFPSEITGGKEFRVVSLIVE
jgi:hydrogenase nickel incorporation protein HypA/HybF